MLEIVLQHPSLEGEYLLWCILEYLPQFGHFHSLDIPYFLMLGDGFSIFHLTQEDKSHPWQTSLELLLTAERHKGEAIIILG